MSHPSRTMELSVLGQGVRVARCKLTVETGVLQEVGETHYVRLICVVEGDGGECLISRPGQKHKRFLVRDQAAQWSKLLDLRAKMAVT